MTTNSPDATCDHERQLNDDSAVYFETPIDRRIIDLVSDYVIARLRGPRVLDLGIGHQQLTPKLVAQFSDVTTVDGSSQLVQSMRQHLSGHEGCWQGVVSLFEDYTPTTKFDTVVASNMLDYVDDPLAILRRARQKWLVPDGQIAIVLPNGLSLHRRLGVTMGLSARPEQLGAMDEYMHHRHCFNCFDVEAMIVRAGLRVVEKQGLLIKTLPNDAFIHCTDDQLRGLVRLGLDLPMEYAAVSYFLCQTGA